MAFTITPYWLIFQLPHWHSIRESSTPPPRHVLFWIARPYVIPVLQELHRLPVAERIQYKFCLMVHKSLLEHTPVYMSDLQLPMPSCSICTACFVVWRPRRAADTSTNQRHGFLCRRTASMEHAADTAQAAAVDHYFSSLTKNISVPVRLWTWENRLMVVL